MFSVRHGYLAKLPTAETVGAVAGSEAPVLYKDAEFDRPKTTLHDIPAQSPRPEQNIAHH
jgi:hypothetical protein